MARALRLIEQGGLDNGDGVDALAARLGIGARQLTRLFARHLGASPARIAATLRLHRARRLLFETGLGVTEIAFAAGFSSLRRFNAAFRAAYGLPPTALRRPVRGAQRSNRRSAHSALADRPVVYVNSQGLAGL